MTEKPNAGRGRPTSYASEAMRARRSLMLQLAREHIADVGFEKFSMSEIARRAGLAKRTLYNAFRSKEHFVAAAIAEFSQERKAELHRAFADDSALGALRRFLLPTVRAKPIERYVAATMALYHSPGVDTEIWQAIHAAALENHRGWIEGLRTRGDLLPGIEPDDASDDLTRLKYALVYDWCRGRITHAESLERQAVAMLTMVRGLLLAEAQPQIEALMQRLRSEGVDNLLDPGTSR